MKLNNLLNLMVLGSVLTVTTVGCKTHPQRATPLPNQNPLPIDSPAPPQFERGPRISDGTPPTVDNNPTTPYNPANTKQIPISGDHSSWIPNPDALKAQTIYFDFDKSAIRSGETSKLEAVAEYLKSNPDAAVRVEGNCDERGTEQYNRSLGERRALAAREYLAHAGIAPERVDTLSNGQDKPAELGHNEAAWSKNRRDEFIVLTPPKP